MDLDWRPWVAGAAAGACMTAMGHPFDTLKVRMQVAQYESTWQCAVQTVRQESFAALYKGLAPAMLTTWLS